MGQQFPISECAMKQAWLWVPLIGSILCILGEALFAPHHQPIFPWHKIVGHMAAIGLASCILIALVSKALGKLGLQRRKGENRDD